MEEAKTSPRPFDDLSPPESSLVESKGVESRGEVQERGSSPTGSPDELALGQVNGHKPKPNKRGTRLPADWQPSEAERRLAIEHGLDLNRVLAEFRDYWVAIPGSKGLKLDWDATFRNRVRQLADRKPPQPEHRVIL